MIDPLRPRDIERVPKSRSVASSENQKNRQPGVAQPVPGHSTDKDLDPVSSRLGNNVDERC
ncbi:MAG: hypothetical protein R3E57_05945 [Porticoccaceae bacterium]